MYTMIIHRLNFVVCGDMKPRTAFIFYLWGESGGQTFLSLLDINIISCLAMLTATKKKKKEKKRRNPNPNTVGLKKIPKIAPEGSAPKSVAVRIPKSQYEAWMSLSSEERNGCLRDAITQKLIEKNLISA